MGNASEKQLPTITSFSALTEKERNISVNKSNENLSFGFENSFKRKKRMMDNSKPQLGFGNVDGKDKINLKNPKKSVFDMIAQSSFLNSIKKEPNPTEEGPTYIKDNTINNLNHRMTLGERQKDG
jgi:hypothetical protein